MSDSVFKVSLWRRAQGQSIEVTRVDNCNLLEGLILACSERDDNCNLLEGLILACFERDDNCNLSKGFIVVCFDVGVQFQHKFK
jgi:hypothetical protein